MYYTSVTICYTRTAHWKQQLIYGICSHVELPCRTNRLGPMLRYLLDCCRILTQVRTQLGCWLQVINSDIQQSTVNATHYTLDERGKQLSKCSNFYTHLVHVNTSTQSEQILQLFYKYILMTTWQWWVSETMDKSTTQHRTLPLTTTTFMPRFEFFFSSDIKLYRSDTHCSQVALRSAQLRVALRLSTWIHTHIPHKHSPSTGLHARRKLSRNRWEIPWK